MHWNINGGTSSNSKLRISLVQSLNPDIISLNETHLPGDEQVDFPGYTWFGNNRKQHVRARKASDGMGVLVKNYLLEQFRINVTDRTMDGILLFTTRGFIKRTGLCCFL